MLHVATNWPGNFARSKETIAALVAAGADVNARATGDVVETALHFAASANDVQAIEALVAAGADLEMDGAVTDGGAPLADAVNFENWDAARKLVQLGAKTNLGEEAALGMLDAIEARFAAAEAPSPFSIHWGFWMACSTNQIAVARFLIERGANVNWTADWDRRTPLDLAEERNHAELMEWLRDHGALHVGELSEDQ